MQSFKDAIRRPIVSAMGILLIIAMTILVCVSVGQAGVAKNVLRGFDDSFTTVALLTAKYQQPEESYEQQFDGNYYTWYVPTQLPEEVKNWLSKMPSENTDIVKAVSSPGLASAYIPNLEVDVFVDHNYENSICYLDPWAPYPSPYGVPYTCAILEFELSEIEEPQQDYLILQRDGKTIQQVEQIISVQMKGKITSVVALHDGYEDPTNYNIIVYLTAPSIEALESFNLILGERYVVYSRAYQDVEWNSNSKYVYFSVGSLPYYENVYIVNDDLSLSPLSVTEKSYIDEYGETVICSVEEYLQRYSTPTIAHVTGSIEAFLDSQEGTEWKTAIEHIEINSHAFPVIGVQNLGYIADFARENVRIVEGRDFTQEELDTGGKVCIISTSLAAKNNINIGDTIDMNYYVYDWSVPYQGYISEGRGVVEPSAYYYTSTTDMTDTENYTVVGFYRDDTEWSHTRGDRYCFTPNTIFVPEISVTGSMDYGDQAVFKTYILKNGSVAKFQQMVVDAGFDGLFSYYDQGYSVISESLFAYDEVAKQALAVSISAFVVLALLYFILFPLQQKKNIAIMYSLGANRRKRMLYFIGSNLCILLPGTLIGFVISIISWQTVNRVLYSATDIEAYFKIEVDVLLLMKVTAIQFICFFAVVTLIAILMTGDRKAFRR